MVAALNDETKTAMPRRSNQTSPDCAVSPAGPKQRDEAVSCAPAFRFNRARNPDQKGRTGFEAVERRGQGGA